MEKRLYEGMFIVDAAKAGAEFPSLVKHVAGLLRRHDSEIERIEKWDDRKLVYPIRRVERGIYVLAYFRCEPGKVSELRHDIRLSEDILRVLILSAEQMSPPKGEVYTPEGEVVPRQPVEQPAVAAKPEVVPQETVEQPAVAAKPEGEGQPGPV